MWQKLATTHKAILFLICLQECRIFVRERDTLSGSLVFDEQYKAITRSRRFIIVLSNSFLLTSTCVEEVKFAGVCPNPIIMNIVYYN